MRSNEDKKKFLEMLERFPWISISAKRVGINRATIYRWRKKNPRFDERVERAKEIGRENLCEFADAKLNSLVQKEHFGAIKLVMEHNDPRYMKASDADNAADEELRWQTERLNQLTDFIYERSADKAEPKPNEAKDEGEEEGESEGSEAPEPPQDP